MLKPNSIRRRPKYIQTMGTTVTIAALVATAFGCSPSEEVSNYGWPGVAPRVVQRGAEGPIPDFDAGRWTGDATVSQCKASCPSGACVPGYGCCPAGEGWSAADNHCIPTGPTDCDTTTAETAAQCAPGWCQAWRDDSGVTCIAGQAGCWLVGRACTDSDSQANRCLAGSVRSAVGVCVLAGSEIEVPVGHELNWQSKTPPKLVPPSAPQALAPLAEATAPRWCTVAGVNTPKTCNAGSEGCAPGEKTLADGSCVATGQVPACPDGFVIDSDAPATAGIPACKPDANCGGDIWGDVVEAPGTFFVDDDAAPGGDGSKSTPLASLADAIKAAEELSTPAIIALASGEYAGDVTLEGKVTLRGSCAAKTRITGVSDHSTLKVKGQGTVVQVHDLTFDGGDEGLRVTDSAHATLKRVRVVGAEETGVRLDGGAKLIATSLLIQGKAHLGLSAGRGLRIDEGASATLNGIRLHGNRDRALYASGSGTSVTGGQWLIDATYGRWVDKKYGRGVEVGDGALVNVSGVSLSGNRTTGVLLDGAASGSSVTELRVVGTLAQESDATHGEGVVIRDCEQVDLIGADLQGNRTTGLAVEGTGTHATVLNVRIANTLARLEDGQRGTGVEIEGAAVTLGWLHIVENRHIGLHISDGAKVAGLAVLVIATEAEGNGSDGRGMSVSGSSSVTLDSVRLTLNRDVGLRAIGAATVVQISDLVVDATLPRLSDASYGRGVSINDGASVLIQGGRLSGNRDEGLHVADPGSSLVASALTIDSTWPRTSDSGRGLGLVGRDGATLEVTNLRCSANHSVGVLLDGLGTVATIGKLLVDGTSGPSALKPEGYGVAVVDHARLNLSAARLVDNEGVGLFAAGTQTVVAVTDLIADHGQPMQGGDLYGGGVAVRRGAHLNLRRARLSANHDVALMAEGTATTVNAVDLLVDGTLPSKADSDGGRAINVERGATLRLRRAWLLDNSDVALYARHPQTSVTAADLWIAGTAGRKNDTFGDAVTIESGAKATVAGLRAEGNAGSGAVAQGGTLILDGLALTAGPEPDLYALVGGVQSIDGGDLTLRGSHLSRPYRLGVAVGHATGVISDVMIDRVAWVGAPPELGKEGAYAADGIAAHKAHLDVKRTLIIGSGRASATQTNAFNSFYRSSALIGGRFGLVVRSGNPPLFEGSVISGQNDLDHTLAMKLDVQVDTPEAHGRSGPGSP